MTQLADSHSSQPRLPKTRREEELEGDILTVLYIILVFWICL